MAKPTHLKILNDGPAAWNKWRKANKNIIPDLSNADLTEINPLTLMSDSLTIYSADLSKYNFTYTNFQNANVAGVRFEGANLSFADFQQAECFETDFRRTSLKEALFQKARMGASKMDEANLSKTNFTETDLSECSFARVNLRNAILVKANAQLSGFKNANLSGANLTEANFSEANCHGVNFSKAELSNSDFFNANLTEAYFFRCEMSNANFSQSSMRKCNLKNANLTNANLSHTGLSKSNLKNVQAMNADFSHSYLGKADLTRGDFEAANFFAANFSEANLTRANLCFTNLRRAILVRTNLSGSNINSACVYGTSVWDIAGDPKTQNSLTITPEDLPEITVDELEVAQFVYLLLNNSKIRNAIDTITSKAVLILGRFYKDRKDVLDALRLELRKRNYIPIVFDFEKPDSRDLTETVATLAQMSRFVIADISDAKSIPQELSHIIPNNPSLPIVSIIAKEFAAYSMYEHFERYPWVLPLYQYRSQKQLIKVIKEKIIIPAESKSKELRPE